MAPQLVARTLVLCSIAFAVALFLPYWATLDGPDTKYVGGTAGIYSVAGSRASSWDVFREGGDAPVPGYVVMARSLLVLAGPVALVALVVSAVGAFRRRAPTSRWAKYAVDSALALAIAFVCCLLAWGNSPHIAGFLAIPALALARMTLGQVPLRSQLYPSAPPVGHISQ